MRDPIWVSFCSAVHQLLERDVLGDDFVQGVHTDEDELTVLEPKQLSVPVEELGVFGEGVGERALLFA